MIWFYQHTVLYSFLFDPENLKELLNFLGKALGLKQLVDEQKLSQPLFS